MMRSPLRRWTVRIALSLLLGALTTVAVTWALSMFDDSPAYVYVGQDVRQRSAMVIEIHDVILSRTIGMTAAHSTRRQTFGELPNQPRSDRLVQIPYWASEIRTASDAYSAGRVESEERNLIAFGWPLRAFKCELPTQHGELEVVTGGFLVGDPPKERIVPYRPIGLGLFVNTLLYATLWLMLFIGIGATRRAIRRTRGRCPRCGYNLRGAFGDGCPECGWNRTSREPIS